MHTCLYIYICIHVHLQQRRGPEGSYPVAARCLLLLLNALCVLQRVAVRCSALQYVAVCYSVSVSQCDAVCCGVLQRFRVLFCVLQCVAVAPAECPLFLYVYVCVYVYVYTHVHMYIRVHVYMCICMYVCMYACIYVCMYVCISVYMCVCVHIYI